METRNITILGENLSLHPYKAVFWMEKETLILCDIHLGKAAHFRKHGIPIPASIHSSDYQRLDCLMQQYTPKRIFILGDLFHSDYNQDWKIFKDWIKKYPEKFFILIKGNHDILNHDMYSCLEVKDSLSMAPFVFTHEPLANCENMYNICGHIHPSVTVQSGPKQSQRVSCFYFGENMGILPSFGNFTGNSKISIKFGDKVYLIIEEKILPFNNISISA